MLFTPHFSFASLGGRQSRASKAIGALALSVAALAVQGCGALSSGQSQPAPISGPSTPSAHSNTPVPSAPAAPPRANTPSAPTAPPQAQAPTKPRDPAPNQGSTAPAPPAPTGNRPEQVGKSGPAPIQDRAIEITGSCSQSEEDGYKEQATLTVANNQVKAMSWQLWVGKRGTCKFDFSDFVQVKTRPSIELASKDGSACKLVIYQDPRRVTLGFADCQKKCTGNIYDDAYPIMFDPRTGGCANLSH